VGDLIRRKWYNSPYLGHQIYFDFKPLRDYGIVMEVDPVNGMIKAYFFDHKQSGPIPIRDGYYEIINKLE
jgi:hypothetical protein